MQNRNHGRLFLHLKNISIASRSQTELSEVVNIFANLKKKKVLLFKKFFGVLKKFKLNKIKFLYSLITESFLTNSFC